MTKNKIHTHYQDIKKQFEEQVVNHFWDKETVVGTQRLSINHIEKILSFLHSTLISQLEEVERVIEDMGKPDGKPHNDTRELHEAMAWQEGYNKAKSDLLLTLQQSKDLISNK